jgi:tmRNA-binding protein
MAEGKGTKVKLVAENRKARHDYFLEETLNAAWC